MRQTDLGEYPGEDFINAFELLRRELRLQQISLRRYEK